jgi:glycosyltransferase involved in cell wall biosynthesis
VLKKHNVPVYLAAHDFKVVCPSYQLNKDGVVCPRNILFHALHCIAHRPIYHASFKNSVLGNIAAACEWFVHKIFKVYERNIDKVIVPSTFVHSKFIEYGWPKDKLVRLPHFSLMPPLLEAKPKGRYVLFAAQLSPEKGVDILNGVARLLPHIPFVVAGDSRMKQSEIQNIRYVGHQGSAVLQEIYREAALVFVPSRFQETFGLSVLEAALQRTPAVASSGGALPELVVEGCTGYLFDVTQENAIKNAADLIEKIWNDPALCQKLGDNALNKALSYTPAAYYPKLAGILFAGLEKA